MKLLLAAAAALIASLVATGAMAQTCDPNGELTMMPDGTVCGGSGIRTFYVQDIQAGDDWQVVEDSIWEEMLPPNLPQYQRGFTFVRNGDGTATARLSPTTTAQFRATIPDLPMFPPPGRVEFNTGSGGCLRGRDSNGDGVPDILCYITTHGTVVVTENGQSRQVTENDLRQAGARC